VNEDVVEARRAVFAERFPAVAARLAQGAADQFAVVERDGQAVDIGVNEQQMYGGDARGFTDGQVAAYMAKPLRVFMNRLDNSGLVSPVCIRLVHALNEQLAADGQDSVAAYPIDNPTFLIVFGVGLGHHLEALMRRTEARWLVLVEPIVGFFEASFRVVDWPAVIAEFERRGGQVHIVAAIDPGVIAAEIGSVMNEHGIAYADGSWVFTHYPLWAFAEARKRLFEGIEFAFVNRGFFEDELRMMENAVANFAHRSFGLLEGKPRLARPETGAVVGAGPSLDESIATLHRIRDRVILFSCGTALRALLRQGLVPDFHCELENVPEVHGLIAEAASHGDLRRVTLIASATVDPRVPSFFGETIFFFRDLVSSTQILGRNFRILPGVAPTCVNLGVAAASFMGIGNLVLFGTDCGVRPGGKRHAEGTVYRDVGSWRDIDRARGHAIEVEGNFGGVIATDWVYDACRLMLANVIGRHRFNVVNCSDGALIPGARPCVPDAFEVVGPAVDRPEFMRTLDRGLRRFEPGAMVAGVDFAALARATDLVLDRLDELLREIGEGEPDFGAAYARIAKFAADAEGRYSCCDSIISGTLNALPRIAMFYGFRIADPTVRRRLFGRFIGEARAIAAEMAARTRALWAELADQVEPGAGALAAQAG
jgi:hypothetical protein